jgi:pilus assembly protein CpaE
MKIAVMSNNAKRLQEIAATLPAHVVTLVEGNLKKMRTIAENGQPDLLLLEAAYFDASDLALIEDVTANFPKIAVVLSCPAADQDLLINAMRAGVREVLPSPPPADAIEKTLQRIASKLAGAKAREQGKILAFMSCKGGSGATFLATNLAYLLAAKKTVLLIDLNLQFGDALTFFQDDKPASTLADVAHDISRLDATLLATSAIRITQNFSILAAPEEPSQALDITAEQIDAILALAVKQYDFVVVDMARALNTLSIKVFDRASRIYPVLQSGLPYLRNAGKLLQAFRSLGYPADKLGWIVNRCEKGSEIGLDDIRRLLDTGSLHRITNSYKEVNASINHGDPLAGHARANSVTKCLVDLMQTLEPAEAKERGFFERVFKRA